jgi:hypothetical protein
MTGTNARSTGNGRAPRVVAVWLLIAALTTGLAPVAHGDETPDDPDLDLMFLLDGSGSIDAQQWQLQKQGLAAAVQDTLAFPLDGTVAVGVIQWSYVSGSNRTRLEIPLTEFNDGPSRQAFVDALLAIPQIGQLTNPGDGVRAGTDHLLEVGRPDSERYLCLSTDGSTNSGETLASATNYAQSNGIDRFSVIALEDAPWFDAQTAQTHYGPHVFGGGTVTFARNVPEFANLIIGGCVNEALELVGLEVNQAVQDWNASVPLVSERPTVVRAFVQTPEGSDSAPTHGRLFGYRNGAPLPGSPIAHSQPGGRAVVADTDVASRRNVLSDSLNFRVPREWTVGEVTFELELAGGSSCLESAPPANTCSVDARFEDVGELSMRLVEVSWRDGEDLRAPTWFDLLNQAHRTFDVMPVASMPFRHGALGHVYEGQPDLSDVIRRLRRMRRWDCVLPWRTCEDHYYGVLEGDGGGRAYRPGSAGAGFMGDSRTRSEGGHARNRIGHELVHNLGGFHTVDGSRGLNDRGQKTGYCNETAPSHAPDFPHFHDVGGVTRPTLGPLAQGAVGTAGDREIWGLAPRFVPSLARLGLTDPNTTFAMMGYCRSADQDGQGRWVSSPTYLDALEHFRSAAPATVTGPADTDVPRLLVGGRIDLTADQASFDAVLPLPEGPPDPPTSGAYDLDLQDATGGVLASVTFDPVPIVGEEDHDEEIADFLIAVADPGDDFDRLVVRRDGVVLGSFTSGPATPEVAIVAPGDGVLLDGQRSVVRWTGSDPDGDDLVYAVAYSPDDGSRWETVAVDLVAEEMDIDLFTLPPSDAARLKVVASDGIRTATALSDPFRVAPQAPRILIDAEDDLGAFYGMQPIVLEAAAVDAGGWSLGDIRWSSDRNGVIGQGPELYAYATDLVEGEHVITATATGATGLSSSTSVTLTIGRIAPPPDDEVGATPIELLDELIAVVQGFALPQGIERSLLAKLETSRNALERDQVDPACHRLRAFSNEVAALADNRLTTAQANDALSRASAIADLLGCGGEDA